MYFFGGENMPVEVANTLRTIGIFFAGLGFFFSGIGILWGVSVWSKQKEKK